MNKSLITNLVAVALVLVGFLFDQTIVLTVGLFALSGRCNKLACNSYAV